MYTGVGNVLALLGGKFHAGPKVVVTAEGLGKHTQGIRHDDHHTYVTDVEK